MSNHSVEMDRLQAEIVGTLRGFAATAAPHVKRLLSHRLTVASASESESESESEANKHRADWRFVHKALTNREGALRRLLLLRIKLFALPLLDFD
jgi:hypothetical protein